MCSDQGTEQDPARKLFDPTVTDRERAIFEGAIALAMVYHQFVGMPISRENIPIIEETIKRAALLQPFREHVEVKINPDLVKSGRAPYEYSVISGKMLDVKVVTKYGKARAVTRMRYVPELDYTLMYIESVSEE